MRTSKIIIAAALTLICSLNSFGQKQEKGSQDTEKKEGAAPAPKGPNKLGLTEDQRKKRQSIRMKTAKDVLPLKNQLGEKKAHLRTITTVDKPDMNEINKTIDEMAALRTQIEKKKIAARMEIRGLLNDEQRLKFDTRDERKDRHMKHKPKGPGRKGKPEEIHPDHD